jgi:hypothetical protein
MTPKEYERIQNKITSLRKEADQATGRLQQLMERLEKEHGCKTVKQAEKLLAKLEKEEAAAEQEYEAALRDFEKQYGDKL